MTNKKKMRAQRRMQAICGLAIALALVALTAMVGAIALSRAGLLSGRSMGAAQVMGDAPATGGGQTMNNTQVMNRVPTVNGNQANTVILPPLPTAKPTPTPTPVPTPSPTPEIRQAELLNVVRRGETSEKKIAITVDDLFQLENLKEISALTHSQGGKLTLFPIGTNLSKPGMSDVLKACVFKMGFEVENHTYTHARVFRLSAEEMAKEIWMQRAAVNQALGANYQQRFFRLMGGDGLYDQRTHDYLAQLGYEGVASWSVSGSDLPIADIKASLAPGAVYLFHTTDGDTAKLREFIPYAVSQGYELVTLNELLGYPDNAISDISTAETVMPMPRSYLPHYSLQRKGDYSWDVVLIQRRLYDLGYLTPSSKSALSDTPADGVYGESTVTAISAYQSSVGLPITGEADEETQRRLLGEETPGGPFL